MHKQFRLNHLTLLVTIVALSGCQPAAKPPVLPPHLPPHHIDGHRALQEVAHITAITPRHSGSDGAARAAQHLHAALSRYTDRCSIDAFEDNSPRGRTPFRNIIGHIDGHSTNTIILASHYDTKSGIAADFQGANDSGSSSGLLIEIARVLSAADPLPFTVMLALFDGEECMVDYGPNDGLHGSRRLVQQLRKQGTLSNIRAMILLDMIGDRDLTVTIPRNCNSEMTALAFDAARAAGIRTAFALSHGAILDDHVPFLEAGIATVNIIDFEYGSRPGLNDYWHTPDDTLDHISPASLQSIGHVVIHMLNRINPAGGAIPE